MVPAYLIHHNQALNRYQAVTTGALTKVSRIFFKQTNAADGHRFNRSVDVDLVFSALTKHLHDDPLTAFLRF